MTFERLDLRVTLLAYHGEKAVLGDPFGRLHLVALADADAARHDGHLLDARVVETCLVRDGQLRVPRPSPLIPAIGVDAAALIPSDAIVELSLYTLTPDDPIWLIAGHDPVTGRWYVGGIFSDAEVARESGARRAGRPPIDRTLRAYLDLDEHRRARRLAEYRRRLRP